MHHIFVIEDDLKLANLIQKFLLKQKFTVDVFNTVQEYCDHNTTFTPSLIICDVMLPDGNGFSLIGNLKKNHDCPIIFLTALDSVQSQIKGLELGANDYLVKPIRPELLLAKVRNIINQQGLNQQSQSLYIDAKKRDAIFLKTPLGLNDNEFEIISFLAKSSPKAVTREVLFKHVIGREYDGLDRAVDLKISRLRKKLKTLFADKEASLDIKSVRGKGYSLDITEP